ncbi:TPA: DUF5615 family PIN-like protein [Thermoplasmata archaeon]|nr:DUF5615 family PIN-like protein [Thermoplasmata archaeon]
MSDERPRFVVDSMLGSLARWLRMLGYDTTYAKDLEDEDIVRLATDEGRTIVTRDRELALKPGAILIDEEELDLQLKAIHEKLSLTLDESAIRCSSCNGTLTDLPKEEASGLVPEGALESNEVFWRCESCGKAYWRGTHWIGIMERLRRLNLA